jgi:hypothetical protein
LLAERIPGAPLYPLILSELARIEQTKGAAARFEAFSGLGVLAVRELDCADGEPGQLAELIFDISAALRVEAGLPYWA